MILFSSLNYKLILNKLYKRLLQTFVRLSLIFLSRNISHRRVISSTYCPIKILLLIFIEKYVFPLGSPISASFSWSTGLEKIAQIPLTWTSIPWSHFHSTSSMAQLSNLWFMPNTVRIGFGSAMNCLLYPHVDSIDTLLPPTAKFVRSGSFSSADY